jgi:predicted CopG family antitoxin
MRTSGRSVCPCVTRRQFARPARQRTGLRPRFWWRDPWRLTLHLCDVHNACMSVKTISLKLEAYERLRAARRYPTESFSEVVLRATWPEDTITAREFLDFRRSVGARFSDDELDRIDALKERETPPEDKWASR